MNKSSVPTIVPEQSESASFVTWVEIHNVDVPAASNHYATVLSPTACTPQWPSVIAIDFEIEAPIHIHNRRVGPTNCSSFAVPQLKRQADHQRLRCAQSSKFILFFV